MTKLWKKARKLSGLARYERTNRRKTMEGGRLKLAYNVPGTKEAGDIHMLRAHTNDIYRRLQALEKGGDDETLATTTQA